MCREDEDDRDDSWKRGKLVADKGFLWSVERWIIIDVDDWRDNLTLGTTQFLVLYDCICVCICIAMICMCMYAMI